jgi:hypothetical protein
MFTLWDRLSPILLRPKGGKFGDFSLPDVKVGPGEVKDLGDVVLRPSGDR